MAKESLEFQIITQSAEDTAALGFRIGEKLRGGDILALSGELGSGKTCFTGGLARGLGVGANYRITSPTFTLINEYPGKFTLYHFDMYRLDGCADLSDLGYEEYISSGGVVVIEWAEKISSAIPSTAFFIKFEHVDENRRKITVANSLPGRIEEIEINCKNGG